MKCQRVGCEALGTAVPTLLVYLQGQDVPPIEMTLTGLLICRIHQADTPADLITASFSWQEFESYFGHPLARERTALRWDVTH